jgi:hypothetical protein
MAWSNSHRNRSEQSPALEVKQGGQDLGKPYTRTFLRDLDLVPAQEGVNVLDRSENGVDIRLPGAYFVKHAHRDANVLQVLDSPIQFQRRFPHVIVNRA